MERARAIKLQGNDFFKQQKYEEAIKCYQEAIKICPPENKEDIAKIHQNIGAVYDQMVSMSLCVCVLTLMEEKERGREGERKREGRERERERERERARE